MATATETTKETKPAETLSDEEIDALTDEEDLVFATRPKKAMSKAQLSRKLYNQQQRSAMGDTAAVVGVGLLTSALDAKVRADAMNDPSVKAAESEIARLQAVTQQEAPKMSEAAKNEMRAALLAPVQAAQSQAERKAQNIAASMGQGSAKQFLDVAEVEIDRLAAQAAKAEAMIAEEEVRLDELNEKKIAQARSDLAPLRKAMFGLRNAMVREPKAQFIRDVGQGISKLISTRAAPDFSFEIERARERGATTEQLETLIEMSNQPFAKRRIEKYMKEIGVFGEQAGEIPADKRGREMPSPPEAESETATEATTEGAEPVDVEPVDVVGMTDEAAAEEAGVRSPGERAEAEAEEARKAAETEEIRKNLEADKARRAAETERIVSMYTLTSELPRVGTLYKKGNYFYGYNEQAGVWTVYPSKAAFFFQRPSTNRQGEPITFTIDQVKNDPRGEVKELYTLAEAEGLIK